MLASRDVGDHDQDLVVAAEDATSLDDLGQPGRRRTTSSADR